MPLSVIAPPSKVITGACDALDDVTAKLLASRATLQGYGEFSSTTEALILLNLVIRQIEGVLTAARQDLVLLPAALVCARAALETAVKAAWMVDMNDPFLRETRWLAHMQEEERVYERSAKRYAEIGRDASSFNARAAEIRSFRTKVESMLPAGVKPLKHNPTVEEMLATLHGKQLYPLYIYLSQYVHGGHAATWLYRQGLGSETRLGEYIKPSHWYIPLRVCWISLKEPGSLTLWRLGHGRKSFLSAPEIERVTTAIERVNATEH